MAKQTFPRRAYLRKGPWERSVRIVASRQEYDELRAAGWKLEKWYADARQELCDDPPKQMNPPADFLVTTYE
ncbi:MAG: hypothetical protein ACREBQ_12570 [Nitrososphaerales archaeon]